MIFTIFICDSYVLDFFNLLIENCCNCNFIWEFKCKFSWFSIAL